MPTQQERINFFKSNTIAQELVQKENRRRSRAGEDRLPEAQIDACLDALIPHLQEKKSLDGFDTTVFFRNENPVRAKQKPQTQNRISENKNEHTFTITECSNGFLLTRGNENFIFRNLKEATNIFRDLFFTKKENQKHDNQKIQLPSTGGNVEVGQTNADAVSESGPEKETLGGDQTLPPSLGAADSRPEDLGS
jgi:hypothetical protein